MKPAEEKDRVHAVDRTRRLQNFGVYSWHQPEWLTRPLAAASACVHRGTSHHRPTIRCGCLAERLFVPTIPPC